MGCFKMILAPFAAERQNRWPSGLDEALRSDNLLPMLKRKSTAQPQERDWFQFSANLIHGLCSDYIALRLLYLLEPLTTAFTIATNMPDVVEKSFKVFIIVHTQSATALSSAR